jgi:hypothetical protein
MRKTALVAEHAVAAALPPDHEQTYLESSFFKAA